MYYNTIRSITRTSGHQEELILHRYIALTLALFILSLRLFSVAVVLSGGGGRGAYQIGVLGALKDLGIEIEAVYGTSVGAINAAGIISEGYEIARDTWYSIDYSELMTVSPALYNLIQGHFRELDTLELASALRSITTSQGIDVAPLRNRLSEMISEDKIRDSEIDFGIVAYSLSNIRPFVMYKENIPEDQLTDYVLASANFPAFKREKIGDLSFIDGGVYSNFPVFMPKERGFDRVVAVDIVGLRLGENLAHVNLFSHGMNVMLIEPSEHFGTVMTFQKEVSQRYLICGYLDTMKAFGQVHGEHYFIYDDFDPLWGLFSCLGDTERPKAMEILGLKAITGGSPNYHYYRQILPWLENVVNSEYCLPEVTVEKMLEELALFLKVERLKPYTPFTLLMAVLDKWDINLYKDERSIQYLTRYKRLLLFLDYLVAKSDKIEEDSVRFKEFEERFRTSLALPLQIFQPPVHRSP